MSEPNVFFIILVTLVVMAPIMGVLVWCLVRDHRAEDGRQRQRERMNDEMWQRINDTLRRKAEEDKAK